MKAGLTWIEERMAYMWGHGDWATHYTGGARWIVYSDESRTAFVVLATNDDHSWIGGDDTCYSARAVAAAIERWSTQSAGLNESPDFIDALERDLSRAEAKGTRLEIIRAKYLLDAMRARVAIALAEDTSPFSGYAQPVLVEDDAEVATLIIPWEAGHDR
jgi:hypothetical protein